MDWGDITRRDVIGFIAGAIVAVAVLAGWYALSGAYGRANMAFGPEWECSNPYGNGPVCVRKPTPPN